MKDQRAAPLKNPLCVALDVDSDTKALELVEQLSDLVGGFKLGPRLIHRYGESLVKKIAHKSPVFIDCKFFDIPSTMEAAVRAGFEAGASLVTVHALAGKEALEKLAKLEQELNRQRPFRILAVTILTSWDESSIPPVFKTQSMKESVVQLAELVKASGLTSVVCSAHEISSLRDKGLYLLTPGIRFGGESTQDQKRVMSPQEALSAGSSALVVGRPIVEAKEPRKIAEQYLAEIEVIPSATKH